jgi:heme oxygenase
MTTNELDPVQEEVVVLTAEEEMASPSPGSERSSLTERMRQASKGHHDQSDKLVNVKLALVLTSKPLYAEAISLFWPIYAELETIMTIHKNHPQLGCLYKFLPLLRRAPLFEKDMAALVGGKDDDDDEDGAVNELKRRRITVDEKGIETYSPPELQQYISHLRRLSEEDPLLLLPYIYSMYSAIVAGGAIIKRMVKTSFALKSDAGVEMFDISFSPKEDQEQQQDPTCAVVVVCTNRADFRTAFRRTINEEMEISESDQVRIVEEAPRVFVRNNALVATARESDAFRTVWATFQRCLWMILTSVGAVVLAVWMYPRLGT